MLERIVGKVVRVLGKRLDRYCPPGARVRDLGLNIFFVRDPEIRTLNKSSRGKDTPTDVLSFSFVENREFMPFVKGEVYMAGEIFLSLDTIARQAKEQNVEYEQEMMYMLVHGVLHVFGYDHQTDREERAMEKQAYLILGRLYPRKKEFGF